MVKPIFFCFNHHHLPWLFSLQVQSQRVSLRSVTSGQLRGFLGDVMRLQDGMGWMRWDAMGWVGWDGMGWVDEFYSL
jgi:hypothetical protein